MPVPNDQSAEIRVIGIQLGALIEDGRENKAALKELTHAVNKLAIIEERQTTHGLAMERAFDAIKNLDGKVTAVQAENDKRIKALEATTPINALTSSAVGKIGMAVILLLVGGMVTSLINKPQQQPAVMIQQAPAQQQPQQQPQAQKPTELKLLYRL